MSACEGCGMNYIREINAFYDWLETNSMSTSAIALWFALMHMCNKTGWAREFAVAISTLSVKTGLSPRAVTNARNELQQKGRIQWRSRKGSQSAVYRIVPLSEQLQAPHSGNCLPAMYSDITSDNASDNRADNRADNHTDNASALYKLNKTETKLDSTSAPRKPFKSLTQEQRFDEFWAKYPKKRSKGQAERAWVKIAPDDALFAQIIEGLERAKRSRDWIKEGGRYIPYPATWLNAKGWEDDYEEVRTSVKRGRAESDEEPGRDFSDLYL